ncbi:glycosyltransferase family A protein [Shimia aestuarii]|uniref:glycosyltransferase family A protein n=1 Tax=Shimia aestuarii TaxID=254406 RepID=UPI001FB4A3BC|nr:glycosyltransferase family A protein [Shimia aestuarii]
MRRHIITLTAIPPRFDRLGPALRSLLRQSVPAEAIRLYIPMRYRRFPDWDGRLPEVPDGVEIRRVEEDFGPATKLLPALKEFAGEDVEILFCDDDMIAPKHWARRFLREREAQPDACLCVCGWDTPESAGADRPMPRAERNPVTFDMLYHLRWMIRWTALKMGAERGFIGRYQFRKGGHIDVFEGFGGVMVRPDFFGDRVFDIPAEAFAVDDVWLSGMAMVSGHPTWAMAHAPQPSAGPGSGRAALLTTVIEGAGRDESNLAAVTYLQREFGIWS